MLPEDWSKHQSCKDNWMSHSLYTAQFGSSDHSSKTCLGGGLIPMAPSTHWKWRWQRRLGCPRWRWRRPWWWWWGRRPTHVHWRRYYWGGHGEHSRMSLKRRTWRGSETREDADPSVSMYNTFTFNLLCFHKCVISTSLDVCTSLWAPELDDRRSRSMCACICCCCSIICLKGQGRK